MHRISKLIFFVFLVLSITAGYFSYRVNNISAGNEGAFPEIKFPCDETSDEEFHSTRPYQGAPCGKANRALYCSNEIQFIETFDLTHKCPNPGSAGESWCDIDDLRVEPHDIYIELSDSEFPILGNTEQVLNNNGGVEEFDDAQKMNEYLSWYLAGVTGKAEYGGPTDEQLVNYTGPLNKLLPLVIQQLTRANNIKNIYDADEYEDPDTGEMITEPNSHDQIVVCESGGKAVPCDEGVKKLRLSDWSESKDLSFLNRILNILPLGDVWNERTPPFPWNFEKQIDYQKAYSEWQGKTCLIVDFWGLQCADLKIGSIDFVPNWWSELYQYLPLGNTTDKKGANYIIGDGPNIQGNRNTTQLVDKSNEFKQFINAILHVPHAQYVKETTELLNKTFQPSGYENERLPETTEVAKNATDNSTCTAANVRVNEGDNLFPGDVAEMQVLGVTYEIDKVKCVSTEKTVKLINRVLNFPCPGPIGTECGEKIEYEPKCIAEVYITVKTGTKTPNADEIFSQTVADSGSTFRKMFPKVEEGAPVECIADMPTVTDVTYDTSQTQKPRISGVGTGEQKEKITNYPDDAASSNTQLTFPHFGSVYEYFLNGIQTALRPKGYGNPIANGNCEPTVLDSCDVTVPDSAVPSKYLGSFKENFIDLADRWSQKCPGPENNMAEECYNFVASVAQKEGVNPAFALTIWLNESGASNYCEGGETTQDMGVNLSEIYQNLPEQVLKFTQLAKQQFCSGMSGYTEPMHGWLSRYQSSAGTCDPSDTVASQYYYDVMNTTWSWVTGCPKNGKFGIQWPTDFSCP